MADPASARREAEEALRSYAACPPEANRSCVTCTPRLAHALRSLLAASPKPAPEGFDPVCPRCLRPLSDHYPDRNNDPVRADSPAEPAPALPEEVREAAEAFRKVNSAQRDDSCTDAGCIVCKRREAGDRLLAALAARKGGA